MRKVMRSLIGTVLILGLCGCGPGGVAVLAALLVSGNGGEKKETRKVLFRVDALGLDNPQPPEGDNYFPVNTELFCKVDAYADDGQPTRYKCIGWTGTGDVPATGGTNDMGPISLTQDSSITWNWQTQYKLTVTSIGSGSATVTDVTDGEWEGDYVEEDATAKITASPASGYVFDHWQDATGTDLGSTNPLTITVDGPKTITAVFRKAVTPTADFTWDPEKPLVAESVQFTDTSTGDIDTWNWDFGDGGTSNEQSPTHEYTTAGVYTVKLSVSGPAGNSEVTHQIAVYDGNIYVDDSGSDGNYGTSWSDAVRTIQRGIDLSNPSRNIGTVVVGDGVYNESDIDFKGKKITVKSANGPHDCVIDCQKVGRAFWFHSGETEDSVLNGFTIINGEASGSGIDGCGGGILCSAGVSPVIKNCIIRDCHAVSDGSPPDFPDGCGGGIGIREGAHPAIVGCRIEKNIADARAGGIFCSGHVPSTAPIKIVNTVIALNMGSGMYGAGGVTIWGSGSSEPCCVEMVNCTVTANQANDASGGGIYVLFMGGLKIANSIVWGNLSASGYADLEATNSTAVADVHNCCINKDASGGNIAYNGKNVFKDPQMIAPVFGNYNLDYTSPCIDAGDDTHLSGGVTEDVTGRSRFFDGDGDGTSTVDMGAYEFAFVKVTPDQSIQGGIDAAEDGDTVLVFPGIYNEWNIDLKGKGVVVRGVGGATSVVIDATMNGRVFSLTNNEPRDAAIVGLTITGADGISMGGGILCSPASPVIKDCVITDNQVTVAGGGILVRNSLMDDIPSDAVIINCRIEYNSADNLSKVTYGGGIAVVGGAALTIICCEISYNEVGLSNAGDGGGLCCRNNSYVQLHNCLISDNIASGGSGGGLYAYNGAHMEVVNCTIAYNSSVFTPLSIYLDTATANVTNCIVWTDTGETQISNVGATVNYSCVEGGWSGSGSNNISDDPRFADPFSGNYHLLDGTKCKDVGDNRVVEWNEDLDGRRRIWGTVDIGCYEGKWLVVPDDFPDISSAITAAGDGDVVALRDQTFSGAGNVNLNPGGRLLWIRSFSLDPSVCIIDGGGSAQMMRIQSGETEELVIEGIGFQNGSATYGGAVYISDASPVFKNVIITNSGANNGGGVYIADGSPIFVNCLIAENVAKMGGGVYCQNNGSEFTVTFINCTITNNGAGIIGGGIRTHNAGSNALVRLVNCIVYGNATSGSYAEIGSEFEVRAYYSDIRQSESSNNVQYMDGCIDDYPNFNDPVNGDYHLAAGSPCIDTGNWRVVTWLFDIELFPRVQGLSVDMGCYEQEGF